MTDLKHAEARNLLQQQIAAGENDISNMTSQITGILVVIELRKATVAGLTEALDILGGPVDLEGVVDGEVIETQGG